MTTNTCSANARTMPTRRDTLGALFTTGAAANATAGLIGLTVQPARPDTLGYLIAAPDDPLLALIARYRDGMAAYNAAPDDDVNADYEALADATYAPAFDEIREHCPPARTFAGAMAAIALAEEEIRDSNSPLCLPLVRAVRAYLVASEG